VHPIATRIAVGVLATMTLAGTACRGTGTVDVPSVSPAPSVTASPGGTASPSGGPTDPATGSPTRSPQVPTRSPDAGPSKAPRSPEAHATGTVGGRTIDLTFSSVAGYPLYDPPDGLASVAWIDDAGNTLSIEADPLFVGTRTTGTGAIVAIGLTDPATTYNSGDGTCSLTITAADRHLFAGRFVCRGMQSLQGEPMTAQGTFSARL
jgi:hypothetical protein